MPGTWVLASWLDGALRRGGLPRAQNALATLPMLLIMLVSGETGVLASSAWPAAGTVALVLSCVAGLGMSYFSFALRAVISATSFSVIGNICKVLTILVNILMWDQHANAAGTLALLVCLGMGSLYQQAPIRSRAVQKRDSPTKAAQQQAPLLPK